MGLVGLAVKDQQMADYAVNSRYGFRHMMATTSRRRPFLGAPLAYHDFVITALLPLAEAMTHCGVDLYGMSVPTDRTTEASPHYVTDTSDQPKSLRLMFETPFYLAFPDLSHPPLGDSDSGPFRGRWQTLVGYHRYRDPKLAWLLRRDVSLPGGETDRGRVGFLHYFRYHYRYQDVQLDSRPVQWQRQEPTYALQGDSVVACDADKTKTIATCSTTRTSVISCCDGR